VSNIGSSNENEVRLKASGDIILNSPSKVEVNCTTAEVNASESVTIDTPETTVTGSLRVEGMLTYVAGMTGSGGSSTATITGDVVVTGDVISNGVVLDSHTHSGVETGSGNTGSPN
jgi:phage baseplate assembly protein V